MLLEKEKTHVAATQLRKNTTPKIRSELLELASEVKANRAMVFEYSNGSSNLIGLPFLYMSATCEVVTPGVRSISGQFQKINTTIVAEFIEKLEEKGYYYTKDIEEIKDSFPVLYSLLITAEVKSLLFYVIYGVHDSIGFMLVATTGNHTFTREESLPRTASSAQRISSLLNLDTLNENL